MEYMVYGIILVATLFFLGIAGWRSSRRYRGSAQSAGKLVRFWRSYPWGIAFCIGAVSIGGGVGWSSLNRKATEERKRLMDAVPAPRRDGYVSSDTCQSCHPAQYKSWHDSYHRTMTQVATTDSVEGDFNNIRLWTFGHWYDLTKRGDEFWVTTDDPAWEFKRLESDVTTAVIEKQVVLTTGSHHYQVYWAKNKFGLEHFHLPFVWLIKEKRWIPREFVFVNPPDNPRMYSHWNGNCLQCHTTAGIPGFDFNEDTKTRKVESKAVELGISCEACHGQGKEHIEANKNPLRRYYYHFAKKHDPTIVNPAKLNSKTSLEVCGQCHSINFNYDTTDLGLNGYRYEAGKDELKKAKLVVNVDMHDHPIVQQTYAGMDIEDFFKHNYFWSDGPPRVTGREFNAIPISKCADGGEMTCITCHSMHQSNPNHQLTAEMETDAACLQCHSGGKEEARKGKKEERKGESYYASKAHTHHDPASDGSRCYNCHMPYTVYGLLHGERSHFIENPSAATTLKTGRPNACNLCHLDKTLTWTDEKLNEWYGTPKTEGFSEDQKRIAASILDSLTGDANQRAIAAINMGWEPAVKTSGGNWMVPYLAQILADPYPAVRFVAERSLRGIDGYNDIQYNFMDANPLLYESLTTVMEQWKSSGAGVPEERGKALLIDPKGTLEGDTYARLMENRNNRPLELME